MRVSDKHRSNKTNRPHAVRVSAIKAALTARIIGVCKCVDPIHPFDGLSRRHKRDLHFTNRYARSDLRAKQCVSTVSLLTNTAQSR